MDIGMVDLKSEYELLQEEINGGLKSVLEGAHFIQGPNVEALEREVAAYCWVRHAIAVASGTDALHLALRAAGIKAGDEVITTPFTFVASAAAISYIGATPVFVDIDPKTCNIDPACVEAAITGRTRAVLPVHLYGQPADLAPIAGLCRKYGLRLIEDSAQSFGAEYGGRKSGAYGDLGCFSFYPSKNLGAYGDAGMVITDDDALAEAVRVYHSHGSRTRYHYELLGYNSRLDELQAVILRVKLKRIDAFNQARRANARRYNALLRDSGLVLPHEDGRGLHVYHQYTVQSERRDALQSALTQAGIASAVYYPVPLHLQELYREQCGGVTLPVAEAVAARVLSLPMSPLLSEGQIERVCQVVLGALGEEVS